MGGKITFSETFMKTSKPIGIVLLAVVILATFGGCTSNESSGIPTELTLDLGNHVTMRLVWIPAGKFLMGGPEGEHLKVTRELSRVLELDEQVAETDNSFAIEGLQREVTISKPFYMGACEVTQEQYEQIMDENPGEFHGEQNPAEQVSWYDATAFCKKLSQKTGRTVRLPTEAQWEYACRAGTTTRFSFGDDDVDLHKYGNYLDKSNTSGIPWQDNDHSDGFDKTAPVGSLRPNDWGLYDMHGNVWEWCSDLFEPFYVSTKHVDPTGATAGIYRVLRGGSWLSPPAYCRSACRLWDTPDDRLDYVGFRVVVLPAGEPPPSTQPATQPSTQPATEQTQDQDKADGNATPPRKFDVSPTTLHIVYLVDRSGSMAQSFLQVQGELLKSISRLHPKNDFIIIYFADDELIEGPRKNLVAATLANKLAARDFLKEITPEGSTTVLPALKRAFQILKYADHRNFGRLVYLLSDGDFAGLSGGSRYTADDGRELNGNEAVIQWLRDNNPKEEKKGLVHVNTFLWSNRDEEARKVMETIAKENAARFKFIPSDE